MRLLNLHIITEYKNLKNFKIDFDESSFIDVFVGKNGTGKSNLLEAVIEIFKHIFRLEDSISFDYKIVYNINGQNISIQSRSGVIVNDNGTTVPFPNNTLLPASILIYYSGHNEIIKDFTNSFNLKHKEKINSQRNNPNFNQEQARKFFNLDKDYKTILLATTLIQSDDLHLKRIIKDKLGIHQVGEEIKITFKKPEYASVEASFDEFVEESRFWGTEGYFRDVLNSIFNVNKIPNPSVRAEGRLGEGREEKYVLYRSFESFSEAFRQKSIFEIFITLDNLKTIGILEEIDVKVTLNTGKEISLGQFSDGQFQSVYILCLTEIFKDLNCISLLDEPDSFLHPEWQFNFFDQINEISNESTNSNHILMSSHSAITLIKFIKEKVGYFEFHETKGYINNKLPKKIAINKLSENLIKLHEQEQLLSIINTIQIENKPILFTEGKTDPLIIKSAYERLYPEEVIPFIPFYCFGHKSVSQIVRDHDVQSDMQGRPIFALFDFDKAFNTFNGFSDDYYINSHVDGLVKKLKDQEIYAMMLPVPDNGIKNQVINPDTGECYNDHSVMTIEHLFFDFVDGNKFQVDTSTPSNPKRFSSDKVDFAKNVVPSLPDEAFNVFKPLFDFIKSKIVLEN